MSRTSLGEGFFTFGGDDAPFQKTAGRVEKSMQQVAAELKKQASDIEVSIAKARLATEGFSEGAEKAMRKVAAAYKRDAKAITDSLEPVQENLKGFINISILTYAAGGLERMGKGAAEMATQIRLGKAEAGDLVEKVAEGIPIIGKFVAAGRGIREALTGDGAYTEVLKQQTELQNKQIELTNEYTAAIKRLNREREDSQTRLGRRPGDSATLAAGSDDIVSALRAIEDARQKAESPFKELFKKLEDEKTERQKELETLIRERPEVVAFSGFIPGESSARAGRDLTRDDTGQVLIAQKRKQIDEISKQEHDLRASIQKTEDLARVTITRGLFTQLGSLAGGELAKGFDAAGNAVERFIGKFEPLQAVTEKALTSLRGGNSPFGQFKADQNAFGLDLGRGNIGQGTFDQLVNKSFLDNAVKALGPFIQQQAAKFGALFSVIDSQLGAPAARSVEFIKRAAGFFPSGINTASGNEHAFQSSFVGVGDLATRIQGSAGSGVPQKQLETLKEIERGGRNFGKTLDKIEANTARGGRAIVGKGT